MLVVLSLILSKMTNRMHKVCLGLHPDPLQDNFSLKRLLKKSGFRDKASGRDPYCSRQLMRPLPQ